MPKRAQGRACATRNRSRRISEVAMLKKLFYASGSVFD